MLILERTSTGRKSKRTAGYYRTRYFITLSISKKKGESDFELVGSVITMELELT